MSSYTSQHRQVPALIREVYNLYQSRSNGIPERVAATIRNLRSVEALVKERFGLELQDLYVLDIGSGQFLAQLIYFSRFNQAVGINLDVIAEGLNPLPYVTMLVANGPQRALKTVGRKLLGIDRRYRKEVMAQLKLKSLPNLDVKRMDACKITFPEQMFDFVYSYSVFHHLPNPGAAISEVARVLKKGAVAYLSFHLFTSETGCLDQRVFQDRQEEIIRWPHLRPKFANRVVSNAYVNRLRLADWQELFAMEMPGAELILNRASRAGIEEDATSLLGRGELEGYSLEELLVHDVAVLWRKP